MKFQVPSSSISFLWWGFFFFLLFNWFSFFGELWST
jgi:hypothetical protein